MNTVKNMKILALKYIIKEDYPGEGRGANY